jgi:O-antigen/teichoic acid export membrane protein
LSPGAVLGSPEHVEASPIATQPTIRRRFAFTVGANALRSLVSFTTSMLLARWLGPASYGSLAFLLGSFLALRSVMDMGASTAFFTFMSQRPRPKRFVSGYFRWLGVQLLVTLLIIGVLLPSPWVNSIWRGEARSLVILALVASFMQDNVWAVLQQAAESQRQTLKVQGIGVAVVSAHLLLVILLWATDRLRLSTVFALIALEYLLAGACAYKFCIARFAAQTRTEEDEPGSVVRRYLAYCLPLVPYSWLSFAYVFADRWLLQNYGGRVQQAFYSIGAQFSAVALLATSSILQVFWKEMAEAHHTGDHLRTHGLYQRVSRIMFMVSAMIACFFIPWSREILGTVLGGTYVAGAATLSVMLLYPIHQSMGLINTTALYATERAATVVKVGTAFMLFGMLVTYFVLAPADAPVPGLGLGSVGLALKLIVLQMVQMNVLGYLVARAFGWKFEWSHQLLSVLGCGALSWVAHAAALTALPGAQQLALSMGVGGLLYLLLVAAFVYASPQLVGLTRMTLTPEVRTLLRQVAGVLRARP